LRRRHDRFELWLGILSAASACRFAADYSGGRFACAEGDECPAGTSCVDGWCTAASPAADGGTTGDVDAPPASDFQFQQRLTFDNRGRGELHDLPVLVALDPERFDYAAVRSDGGDLQFRDADGALLPHEIETWDPQGRSSLWVRIPSIDADTADDYIWLHYGNPDLARDDRLAESVWSSYLAVYHMGDGDQEVEDSTAQGLAGVAIGSQSAAGFIGQAHAFDGVDQYVDLGAGRDFLRDVPGATLELWARPAAHGPGVLLAASNHSTVAGSYPSRAQALLNPDGTVEGGGRALDEGELAAATSADPLTLGAWSWVVVVIDYAGDRVEVHLNGQLAGAGEEFGLQPRSPDTTSSQAAIGVDEELIHDFFTGLIDEVRIAGRANSRDWIAAQYAAMTDRLITYAAPEARSSAAR